MMRNCSVSVLRHMDAGFEPRCPHKEFLASVRFHLCILENGSLTAHFQLKTNHSMAPRHGTRLIEHPFAIIS